MGKKNMIGKKMISGKKEIFGEAGLLTVLIAAGLLLFRAGGFGLNGKGMFLKSTLR